MKVRDPGHIYALQNLDAPPASISDFQMLHFVKRVGDKYPGNQPPAFSGTNLQDVFRACIDRIKYVNQQIPHPANKILLINLRACIYQLELRAAKRHGRELKIKNMSHIEDLPTCPKCGHIECEGQCHG